MILAKRTVAEAKTERVVAGNQGMLTDSSCPGRAEILQPTGLGMRDVLA